MIRNWLAYSVVVLLILTIDIFGSGLPGEYLVSSRWRVLTGQHSPLNNPAFLTDANYTTVRGAFCGSPMSASSLWELGAVVPLGLYQSVGLSCVGENGGDVAGGTLVNNGGTWQYTESSSTRTNHNYFVMGSYAVNPWRALSLGLNVNAAYQTGFGDPTTGAGVDVGIAYRLMQHPFWGYHNVGLMYQNLVAPQLAQGPKDPNAAQIKLSLLSRLAEGRLEGLLEMRLADFATPAENFIAGEKLIEWDASYTLGLWLLRFLKLYGIAGFDRDGVQYLSWAAGVNVPMANAGRDLSFVYQLRNEISNPMAPAHSAYVTIDLGKHREENHARRIGQHLSIEPNLLYNKALELYWAGRYWDALFVFSQIKSRFPDFFKMDWVSYYRGSCYEKLDMRKKALAEYDATSADFGKSPVVPYASLGAMRVDYRNGDLSNVFTRYIDLNKPAVPDSLNFHGHYFFAQALMADGQSREAIRVLSKIPQGHPDYLYARHSLAVAYFQGGNMAGAQDALRECLLVPVQDKAGAEIIARSHVLIGCMFYEQVLLAKAVLAFRLVPKTSIYYVDALQGLGWAAIQAQQWGDCLVTGQALQAAANDDILRAEGLMFEGTAALAQKDYVTAETILSNASALLQQSSAPSLDSLEMRQHAAKMERIQYEYLAGEVDEYSFSTISSASTAFLDSMHIRQIAIKQTLDKFVTYQDRFARSQFFAKSISELTADINYLLATAQKLAANKKSIKVQNKMVDEQRKLNEEIQKLEQEMNQLDKSPN